jgi:hypothetical protein
MRRHSQFFIATVFYGGAYGFCRDIHVKPFEYFFGITTVLLFIVGIIFFGIDRHRQHYQWINNYVGQQGCSLDELVPPTLVAEDHT